MIYMSTPWGSADQRIEVAEGIVRFYTPSHGGYWLSKERVATMPGVLRRATRDLSRCDGGWYEEDCEWCFVALSFPQYFSADDLEAADKTMRDWHPDVWEVFRGVTLLPGQSAQKDEQAFLSKHSGDQIVIAAFGSWAEGVPDGLVGVMATLGGDRSESARRSATWWLVPEAEYNSRRFAFVIDPARHQKITPLTGESARKNK